MRVNCGSGMWAFSSLCLLLVAGGVEKVSGNVEKLLEQFNNELFLVRHNAAEIAWNMSIDMNQRILDENERFTIQRNIWTNEWCSRLMELYEVERSSPFPVPWSMEQLRQIYLICRGPRFSSYQLSNILAILSSMQKLYNQEICMDGTCMRVEPDLNRIMESSRDEGLLKKVWGTWHNKIGQDVKPLYVQLIHMLNQGARQAGHKDMGECWREETEIPNLKSVAINLYLEVRELYELLHAFVRFKLGKFYEIEFPGGMIPSHLLGNLYAQNWQSLMDIVWEEDEEDDEGLRQNETKEMNPLVKAFLPKNATVLDLVKGAEDFFVSMGLPQLPDAFWRNSYFETTGANDTRNCHGSAANMFGMLEPDYRIMMCAEVKDADLVTFQHEVGHVMYFMAYSHLPTIFQDGANSAFHESVGDSVTYDLKTHSSRQGHVDMKSLLRTGLAKIPQVGYGLVMDMWRWKIFVNEKDASQWNREWWSLHHSILGVSKPSPSALGPVRESDLLDAAGKFHIIDNIPYIRYFFASFLQIQLYESMCEAAGWRDMHACKIRGSKAAGQRLWKMLSQGSRKHWSEILEEMTGSREITSKPFLAYFKPLKLWLLKKVKKYNLTVGWDGQGDSLHMSESG